MANAVNVEVVTPGKKFFQGPVECITVKTLEGEESFMAGHTWACKLLDTGIMKIREQGEEEPRVAAISGGYIDVRDNILVFTDAAEWAEDIDLERATKAKATLEDWLASAKSEDSVELDEAKTLLKREMARMSIGKK